MICRALIFVFMFVFAAASFAFAHCKSPVDGKPLLLDALYAPASGVKIDGNLDEWHGVPFAKIDSEKQISFKDGDFVWQGSADCSGEIAFLWDEKYLYFAVRVNDNVAAAPREPSLLWESDSVEIVLDNYNLISGFELFPESSLCMRGISGGVHYQFGVSPFLTKKNFPFLFNWCNPDPLRKMSLCDDYIKVASYISEPYRGYVIEGAIRLSKCPYLDVSRNRTIGFNWAINDCDGGNKRNLQMTWSGHESHGNAGYAGDLRFSEKQASGRK